MIDSWINYKHWSSFGSDNFLNLNTSANNEKPSEHITLVLTTSSCFSVHTFACKFYWSNNVNQTFLVVYLVGLGVC